jgi:hypothetical protein
MISFDPDGKAEYTFDWAKDMYLDGDSIATPTILQRPEDELTIGQPTVVDGTYGGNTIQDSQVVVFIEGGEVGRVYEVTCRILTTEGRKFDKTELFAGGNL